MLGKLKQTTKEKCPLCGKNLQIRIFFEKGFDDDGSETSRQKEIMQCSSCEYEEKIGKKRGNKKETKWR